MEHILQNKVPQKSGWFRENNLAQAWLVLLLAIGFGAALAAVQVNLSGRILANKQNETLEKIPELVWGKSGVRQITARNETIKITPGILQTRSGPKIATFKVFRVTRENQLAGWVIKTGGQGYADKIELLIGVDPGVKTLTGLFILDQKETPGLGNKITSPGWRRQFKGKSTAQPLEVTKAASGTGRTVDAITGATISSRSVTLIINQAITSVKGTLTPDTFRPSER